MNNLSLRHIFCVCLLLIVVTSCKSHPEGIPFDRSLGLDRDEYRKILGQDKSKESGNIEISAKTLAPPLPKIAPILSAPRPPKIGKTRLVSITVTDDVPLKDVLMELGRLADVDMEIDSGIEGGISFRAKERPFNEVIERISDMAGLRYKIKDNVLRIERDTEYVVNYNLDFLNIVRSRESNINIATDVLALASSAGGDSGSSGGFSTGSSASISSKAEDDFWDSLEAGIKQILKHKAPLLQYIPEDDSLEAAATASSGNAEDEGPGFLIANRQAGLLTISATSRQHEMIKAYIDRLRYNASAQVLIEAKIVEVTLNDEYRTGISWQNLVDAADVNGIDISFNPSFPDTSNLSTFKIDTHKFGIDLNTVVQMVEKFGTTRTLSSPRLHAINNQPAVLTFAENKVFFEVKVTQEDDTIVDGQLLPGKLSVESERRSVPIGIILNVMPSINLATNEITLNVRPTLSRLVSSVVDPGSALVNQLIVEQGGSSEAAAFTNEVPVVEVRELDSIMKIKSGQVMVIGGLMEHTSSNTDTGVPYVSRVPWFGNLFKSVEKVDRVKELVIFIRATIVGTNGSYHDADRQLYNNFSSDPRPLEF